MTADARLAVPAVAGWALLAVLLGFPAALPWAAGGCWLLAAVALVASPTSPAWRRALVVVSMCATVGALMLSSAALATPGRWPAVLAEAVDTGTVVRGIVSTTQAVHGNENRFNATLTKGTVAGERFAGSVPVLVFGAAGGPVGIGSELRVVGTLGAAD